MAAHEDLQKAINAINATQFTPKARNLRSPVQFLHDMWGQELSFQNGYLTMPSIHLQDTNFRLFMFSEYRLTMDRFVEFRARYLDKNNPRMLASVLVTGNPGIGKSCWLEYLAALEVSAGRPLVYYFLSTFYLIRQDGVYTISEKLLRSFQEPFFHHLLCLVDAAGPAPLDLPICTPMIVQATSPLVDHYKWRKQRTGINMLYVMNPPSVSELKSALQLHDSSPINQQPSDAEYSEVLAKYGPNIRTIRKAMSSLTAVQNDIRMTVAHLDPGSIQTIIQTPGPLRANHSIFTSSRLDDVAVAMEDDTLVHSVSNLFIWRLVLAAHVQHNNNKLRKLFNSFNHLPQTVTTAGWLFESRSHQRICEGGPLLLIPMISDNGHYERGSSPPLTLNYPALTPVVFESSTPSDETQVQDVYYIPAAPNNPTFDSLARFGGRRLGFQMTISATHSLKVKGLAALSKRLQEGNSDEKAVFVFVIPAGKPFRCKAPAARYQDTFDFYTLDADMQIVYPSGDIPARLEADDDEEEAEDPIEMHEEPTVNTSAF